MATRWERWLCRARLDVELFDFTFTDGAAVEVLDGDDSLEVGMPRVSMTWPRHAAACCPRNATLASLVILCGRKTSALAVCHTRNPCNIRDVCHMLRNCPYTQHRASFTYEAVTLSQALLCDSNEREARAQEFAAEGGVGMLNADGARQSGPSACMPGANSHLPSGQHGVTHPLHTSPRTELSDPKWRSTRPQMLFITLHTQN